MDNKNLDWFTKEEAEAFIGVRSSYYMNKWGGSERFIRLSWNWSAALFNFVWMAYRRMYIELLFLFLIWLVNTIIVTTATTLLETQLLISLTPCLIIGIFGNELYRRKALRTLSKTRNMSDLERIKYLETKGGVNFWWVILLIILGIINSITNTLRILMT